MNDKFENLQIIIVPIFSDILAFELESISIILGSPTDNVIVALARKI